MKRIAIVTGASSGIGKEFFLSLREKQAEIDEVWVIARNGDKLMALTELSPFPLKIFPLDLSLPDSVKSIEQALLKEKPSVQYVICASGFGRFCAVESDNAETLQNMVDLNCRSIVGLTHATIPYLAKGGAVILIASMAAFQPIPYIATYGATKAFVLSYGRALDKELRKTKGARCLCVCPFWTKTAFFERAIAKEKDNVVKKYTVMYEPQQIVKRAWKDLKRKNRDVSVYGVIARGQKRLVKLLPHKWIMRIWLKQQKLK